MYSYKIVVGAVSEVRECGRGRPDRRNATLNVVNRETGYLDRAVSNSVD